MLDNKTYTQPESIERRLPNHWDMLAFLIVLALFVLIGWGSLQMTTPYRVGQEIPVSLDPANLPHYALRSVLRMFFAILFSLLATFIFGTLAAKSRHAERILIPFVDILQSVPILGYLSITMVFFISLFSGSLLGPECAAIFAIFTSQVWNMILSFYQSVKSVPREMLEVSKVFHLTPWQHFWKIDVPFAMPGLLWNTMLSISGSWFFVVAAEAISENLLLPGIGSYIAKAVSQMNIKAVVYAILAMFVVILIYDQLFFRPLNRWVEKFKWEKTLIETGSDPWILILFQRTKFLKKGADFLALAWDGFVNHLFTASKALTDDKPSIFRTASFQRILVIFGYILLIFIALTSTAILAQFAYSTLTLKEVLHVFYLGSVTALRVMVVVFISILIWTPIGVWIGLRPRVTAVMQPVIQFLAAFPANLFFPIVVLLIVRYQLNVNIWTSPLMILGTQWYILFNVIAGTAALPQELLQTAMNLHVRGLLWWRRLVLPGIFPYIITGALTAAGGAWNASIVTEYVNWGDTTLQATGLGSYIKFYTQLYDYPKIILGIGVMALYVLLINYLVWRPLYRLAVRKFSLD